MATNGQPVLATDLADASLEDPAATSIAADSLANDADADVGESGEEDEEGEQETGTTTAAKKKWKPRKKKKNKPAVDESIPSSTSISAQPPAQSRKDLVTKKPAPVHDIQSLLNQLAMSSQQQQPKPEAKAPQDYKFWNTQPVPKFQEPNLLQLTTPNSSSETSAPLPEGPILPDRICRASAKSEPGALRDGFEWCLVDLEAEDEVKELYDLLDNHYVEDAEASFRFKYSVAFLSWALKPPGWKKEWHIGVRTATTPEGKKGKLVAFIAGIPVRLKVGEASMNGVEINFLAIHRKLRGKRLAPELIKEVTRRCYRNEIFQALYTAGTLLPTPVSTCRYFHRSLDWEHLYKTGFSHLPPGSSELKQRVKYRLESQSTLKGLRPMRKGDVSAVKALLERYLDRFHLRQAWTEEEVEHWFCSEASQGVVWAYVVESEDGSGVEDFVSYYLLESTVLKSNSRTEIIRAAYLFYYATSAAFPSASASATNSSSTSTSTSLATASSQQTLANRLQLLIHNALIHAAQQKFHVFNALTLLDNPLFLKQERFEPGDGKLHYYLFNWRCRPLPGGVDAKDELDAGMMGGVGVVML